MQSRSVLAMVAAGLLSAALSCGDSGNDPLFENNAGSGGQLDDAGDASVGAGGSAGGSEGGAGGASSEGGAGGASSEGGAGGTSAGGSGTGGATNQGGSSGQAGSPPTIGTEFWAVDLPNERGGISSNVADWPSQKPWGVLIANHAATSAHVVIERNKAPYGSAPALEPVTAIDVPAGAVTPVNLPTQEVTGWSATTADPPGPPGTFLSSNAFRISANAPVSVVQFNSLDDVSSTDASALLSRGALGTSYRVVGWPTANPVAYPGMTMAGIPDHTSVTIVGTVAGTSVTVTLGGAIVGDGAAIPATPAGGVVHATLGPFDVLNLSSFGGTQSAPLKGDLTGTLVEASNPVAVFTSAERATAKAAGAPADDACCTEHLEEQVRPATVAGSSFVVVHSPWRSTGAPHEPDLLRFLSLSAPAQVVTSLPAPFDHFNLNPGEFLDAWTTADAVVTSTAPLSVAQLLVSKTMTADQIGDPSMLILPPVSEYRTRYLVTVPAGWSKAGVSIATPEGNSLSLDGAAMQCDKAPAGTVDGTAFEAMRCLVTPGSHVLGGSKPFGASVFGYGASSAWSYAASGD